MLPKLFLHRASIDERGLISPTIKCLAIHQLVRSRANMCTCASYLLPCCFLGPPLVAPVRQTMKENEAAARPSAAHIQRLRPSLAHTTRPTRAQSIRARIQIPSMPIMTYRARQRTQIQNFLMSLGSPRRVAGRVGVGMRGADV